MAKKKTKAIIDSVGSIVDSQVNSGLTGKALSNQYLNVGPATAYQSSPAFRKAVDVISDNESKATLRLFSRSTGDEILSGPVYDLFHRPNRYQSCYHFINELRKYDLIFGEMAILPILNAAGLPVALKLLNPASLIPFPYNVRSLEFVESWHYYNGLQIDGKSPMIEIPAERMLFSATFNPNISVRGVSKALTSANEITTNINIQRFHGQYFKNGANTNLVFKFPAGTRQDVMDDYLNRWMSNHSIQGDRGFIASAVAGDDFEILPTSQVPDGAAFLQLSQYNDEKIASLLGVPASIFGFYSKTRFDTIDQEIEMFAENTLLPNMRRTSEFLQSLVDQYFPDYEAVATKKRTVKMSKALKQEYNFAAQKSISDIIVVLDPDSLPIMNRLQQGKLDRIKQLRDNLMLSTNEACDYLGVEIPYNPIRDQIYVTSGLMLIKEDGYTDLTAGNINGNVIESGSSSSSSSSEINDETDIQPSDLPSENPEDIEIKENDDVNKTVQNKINNWYRLFRKEALSWINGSKPFNKDLVHHAAEEISDDLVLAFHQEFLAISEIKKLDNTNLEKTKLIKKLFNQLQKPQSIKEIIKD